MADRGWLYNLRDKVRGCIVGTAVGDALGMPVEGMRREVILEQYGRITGYLDSASRYSQGLTRGQWTDDTKLTIATAEGLIDSLLKSGVINLDHIRQKCLNRYLVALEDHKNRGFGKTTRESLEDRRVGKDPFDGRHPKRPGNGCAMRIAPVGILFGLLEYLEYRSLLLRDVVTQVSLLTHNDSRSLTSAFVQAYAVKMAWLGKEFTKDVFDTLVGLAKLFEESQEDKEKPAVSDALSRAAKLIDFSDEAIAETLGTTGSAHESFPTALCYALKYKDDFRSAVLAGVNAGGDTDTIAAMTGAIVGARLGMDAIPEEWKKRDLEAYEYIVSLADRLWGTAAWVAFGRKR